MKNPSHSILKNKIEIVLVPVTHINTLRNLVLGSIPVAALVLQNNNF
jgi:hypothetical protein